MFRTFSTARNNGKTNVMSFLIILVSCFRFIIYSTQNLFK